MEKDDFSKRVKELMGYQKPEVKPSPVKPTVETPKEVIKTINKIAPEIKKEKLFAIFLRTGIRDTATSWKGFIASMGNDAIIASGNPYEQLLVLVRSKDHTTESLRKLFLSASGPRNTMAVFVAEVKDWSGHLKPSVFEFINK